MWFERNFIKDLENLQGAMDDFFQEKEQEYRLGVIPANIYQSKDKLFVALPLPGIPKESIALNYQNGTLSIVARKTEDLKDLKRILRKERKTGEYARNIKIEQAVDPESINAKYINGFLLVELTKKEEAKTRKIQID